MIVNGRTSPLSDLPDAELISYCGSVDDPQVWNEFVNRFHRRILLYIAREYRSYGLVDTDLDVIPDLAQEVYLRLLSSDRRALREFRASNEFAVPAYFACVVHSVVADHMRRQQSQKRAVLLVQLDKPTANTDEKLSLKDILMAGEETSPEEILKEKLALEEFQALLKSALSGSNAHRDALIFQLHILHDLSAREIAQLPNFDITVMNVEAIIRRTRERVRNMYKNPPEMSV